MARLIDADAAKIRFANYREDCINEDDINAANVFADVVSELDEFPTIDPVTAAAEALGMSPDRLRELAQAEKKERLMKYLSLKKENENRRERLARMKAGAEIHGRTYEYLKDSGAPGRESGRVITNPAAPWLMPQHTGSGGDAMAKSVEQYLEYEKEISPLITANDKEIACINAAVHALSDPMEREVLRLRYLDGDGDSYRLMRWREVAIRIYGDDDAKDIISAQRLHDKALLEIDFV